MTIGAAPHFEFFRHFEGMALAAVAGSLDVTTNALVLAPSFWVSKNLAEPYLRQLLSTQATHRPMNRSWRFPNGSTLKLDACSDEFWELSHRGREYGIIAFMAGVGPDAQTAIRSRLRMAPHRELVVG